MEIRRSDSGEIFHLQRMVPKESKWATNQWIQISIAGINFQLDLAASLCFGCIRAVVMVLCRARQSHGSGAHGWAQPASGPGWPPPDSLLWFFPPDEDLDNQGLSIPPWAVASPCCAVSSALWFHWAQLLKGFWSAKRLFYTHGPVDVHMQPPALQNPRENLFLGRPEQNTVSLQLQPQWWPAQYPGGELVSNNDNWYFYKWKPAWLTSILFPFFCYLYCSDARQQISVIESRVLSPYNRTKYLLKCSQNKSVGGRKGKVTCSLVPYNSRLPCSSLSTFTHPWWHFFLLALPCFKPRFIVNTICFPDKRSAWCIYPGSRRVPGGALAAGRGCSDPKLFIEILIWGTRRTNHAGVTPCHSPWLGHPPVSSAVLHNQFLY